MGVFSEWIDQSSFSPHGFCLSWQPGLLELHAVSDAVTGICYMAVGFLIFQFGRRRPDMGPAALFNALFAVFFLCGLTHIVDILVLWRPVYVEQGLLKAVTAAGSLPILIILIKLVPKAISLPSPAQLAKVNCHLAEEVALGHEREQRLRTLSLAVEQNPNIIVITDANGVIEYVNPSFCKMTGYSVEEAIGQNPRILKSAETPAEVYLDLWTTILSGREWRGELNDRCKDGRTFWSSVVISPVLEEHGSISHFIAMHENIAERKLAEDATKQGREQAETASRSKSEILTNMSHELRTPLNAVIGYSEALLTGMFGTAPTPKFEEYIDDIHDAGRHLLRIINDILDVSAIDAGKIDLQEEPVSVRDVVEASVRLMAPRAEKSQVVVSDEVPTYLPHLRADERRLKQIILNLLSNAVKFTPPGGTVKISTRMTEAGNMGIIVADTGIGMDQAGIAKALSLFGQVDSGLARSHEGSGLGLPLTNGLVELHGGTLAIASEKGVGTTVTVTFPAERVEAA